ncbi:MAG TPA: uroporphyrinogen decarboxylase family protein [Candidatus Lokiarchaeia archaeon]|nr:uroporphyrinogen decarboxylase family protein [Candidatus Lokiarchaeia archaeon]
MALLPFLPLHITAGFSFASDWFYHNAGIAFDEQTMRDPLARIEQGKRQQEYLHERYPEIFPKPMNERGSPGLGIGVATLPILFGSRVRFTDHMDPIALPVIKANEDVTSLKEPDLDDAMQWLYDEIDTLVDAGYARNAIGLPNMQGPLNVAFRVIDDNRMLSLIARPAKEPALRQLLDTITGTFIEATRRLRKATNHPETGPFTMAGCTYYYLSPNQWRRVERPTLEQCAVLGEMGLHYCGMATNDQLDAYAEWPWTAVEFGFGTDLAHARQLFISKTRGPLSFSCRVSPFRMLNQSATQITADVNWIIDHVTGGLTSINVVGIPWKTPEENIMAMKYAVDAFNARKAAEEGEEFEESTAEPVLQ